MTTTRNYEPSAGNEMITIQGIIVPCAWDEKGTITAVTIDTFDERSFQVVDQGEGEGLKGFTRRRVEAWGLVDVNQELPVLTLAGYRFLTTGDEV